MRLSRISSGVVLGTTFLLLLAQMGCTGNVSENSGPKGLIERMVREVGGKDRLYALRDVAYEYTYHHPASGKKDVSLERYLFDGELSWAKYAVREKIILPNLTGEMIQGYNGTETWVTLDGKLRDDPRASRISDFVRKTNFYWFTMMFKLLDPGVNYAAKGTKNVDGVDYDLVQITFGENVGDAQDTYTLYINPETHLVDQFLFTVMDFGVTEPFLMKVEYEEVEGLKLPAKRTYVAADWEGVPKNDDWTEELSTNIRFNNGFTRQMFERPAAAELSSKH